jgi:predicted naringenin-chalcone synthase
MNKDIYLHMFSSILPKYHLPQADIVDWTLKAHARSECLLAGKEINEEDLRRFCIGQNQIKQRYFECPDTNESWNDHEIYKLLEVTPRGEDIYNRNIFFQKCSINVLEELYGGSSSIPDHLIHVTCTGYSSPSSPQRYFQAKEKAPAITHAYHMGCYASLPAVRLAKALVGSEDESSVDILHNETCSLHMDPSVHTAEQMVVQTLFADGHIRYRVTANAKGRAFKVKLVQEKILKDSMDDMTWVPGAYGMRMTLSRKVPVKLRSIIPEFLDELCQKAGVDWQALKKDALFAVHPGGPRIIESAQRTMDLRDDQVIFSYSVLKSRGNMSSATLPHVWKEILESDYPAGTHVVSLAFGPGLTIFGSLFELVDV